MPYVEVYIDDEWHHTDDCEGLDGSWVRDIIEQKIFEVQHLLIVKELSTVEVLEELLREVRDG